MITAAEKPYILPVELSGIPAELGKLPQWIIWRLKWDNRREDWSKIPYQSRRPHSHAKSNAASTWSTYADAIAVYERGGASGIGFVFAATDPYTGVDLDDCIGADGQLLPWGQEIVSRFDTYTERSPSGTGLKLWCKGKLPTDQTGKKRPIPGVEVGAVEAYDERKYYTMTGQRWPGTPGTIEDRQEVIDWLWGKYFADEAKSPGGHENNGHASLDDEELLEMARKARNGFKFTALWSGQWEGNYTSQSEADLALCNLLAFWCGPDHERIDRLFRRSDLCRDKSTQRADYLAGTIAKAIIGRKGKFYKPRKQKPVEQDSGEQGVAEKSSDDVHLTDLGNARRLVQAHGVDLRYCHPWKSWIVWNGKQWREDDTAAAERRAKDTIQKMFLEAAAFTGPEKRGRLLKHAMATEKAARVEAMLKLARSEHGIPILPDEMDQHPWLLNCVNGIVDLQTGELKPHDRALMLTNLCPTAYDSNAQCPRWLSFLERIMDGNADIIGFIQRALGYSLLGKNYEEVLFILHGEGANGKSVFLNTILTLLGTDFGMKADRTLLMQTRHEQHCTVTADLFGQRFVAAIETEEGQHLAESFVKENTGGDLMNARRLYEKKSLQFQPSHKLWLSCNHKPIVRGTDHAIWRRLRLIPFQVTIPKHEQDKKLKEKLELEAAGILAWAVRGCLAWHRDGLAEPVEIRNATAGYRAESDFVQEFLDEECVICPMQSETARDLYYAYKRWSDSQMCSLMTPKRFGLELRKKGFASTNSGGRSYSKIGLKTRYPD